MNIRVSIVCFGLSFAFAASNAFAQAHLEWLATHDGAQAGLPDGAVDAAADAQGNVYVASDVRLTASDTNVDVIAYSPSGALLWSRRFDLPNSDVDHSSDIALAPNGDLCVVGYGSAPDNDLFLVRYDAAGNLLWSVIFGGAPGSGVDTGRALGFDSAGNAIVAGSVTDASGNLDMLVQSYQPNGALLWETRIDGPEHGADEANALTIDASGSIFVAGRFDYAGSAQAGVAKLDAQGQMLWLRELNLSYPLAYDDQFRRIAPDGEGGVLAIGTTNIYFTWYFFTRQNSLLARYDGAGNLRWSSVYGSVLMTSGTDVIVDDFGVVNALYAYDFLGTTKATVQRLSLFGGAVLSTSDYDGLLHNGATGANFVRGTAGQLFIAGREGSGILSANDQAFLMQRDSSGATNWIERAAGSNFAPWIGRAISAPNGRVVLCGQAYSPSSDADALVMQFDVSDSPQTYCTAKTNFLGCTPPIGFTGESSASSASGFTLSASRIRNNKFGICLYSISGPAANPFGGGTLCVAGPILRTPPRSSGGNAPPANDCSGVYSIDMNAFAQGALGGHPLAALTVPGTTVYAQFWGRDPGFVAPDNIALSNALRYVVLP